MIEMEERIDTIITLLYQQKVNDGIKKIELLLPDIEAAAMKLYNKDDINFLNAILYRFFDALKNEDTIMLADILKYEFWEFLKDKIAA